MDALILSCGTGGGHNAACHAIEKELKSRGHAVETLNPYLLKSARAARAVDLAYVRLAQRAPAAFGAVYGIGNAYRRLPVRSPVYHLNRRMRPVFADYLEKHHFDAVVMTHLFPAEILTGIRRHMSVPKSFFISTDYTCIPFTEETDCDYYVIPSPELADEFCGRGIAKERIRPLGIPVDTDFTPVLLPAEERRRSREALGLSAEERYRYILVAGGSIGAGRIDEAVSLLLGHYEGTDTKIIVVCGNNEELYRKLNRQFGARCTVLAHTDRMPEYLKACDVFLSKPGGLSTTEAAVAGIPLVLMTPIPGCETLNMRFFEERGMCEAVSSIKTDLIPACEKLLDQTAAEKMRRCQRQSLPAHAARAICDLIEQSAADAS